MKMLFKILFFIFLWISCESSSKSENVYGCIDYTACNFTENSNIDDGSCIYSDENYDCDGICISLDECGNCVGDMIVNVNLYDECYNISTTTSLDLNNQEITFIPNEINQ